jgi:hypothetical protein
MFFPIPNPFSSKDRRIVKKINTENLDRPFPKKGFASILKKDEAKFVQDTSPVHPHTANAYNLRMRGIA